jgi:hypothetical protein
VLRGQRGLRRAISISRNLPKPPAKPTTKQRPPSLRLLSPPYLASRLTRNGAQCGTPLAWGSAQHKSSVVLRLFLRSILIRSFRLGSCSEVVLLPCFFLRAHGNASAILLAVWSSVKGWCMDNGKCLFSSFFFLSNYFSV